MPTVGNTTVGHSSSGDDGNHDEIEAVYARAGLPPLSFSVGHIANAGMSGELDFCGIHARWTRRC